MLWHSSAMKRLPIPGHLYKQGQSCFCCYRYCRAVDIEVGPIRSFVRYDPSGPLSDTLFSPFSQSNVNYCRGEQKQRKEAVRESI